MLIEILFILFFIASLFFITPFMLMNDWLVTMKHPSLMHF